VGHVFWTALLGLTALLWIIEALVLARGVPLIPSLQDSTPAPDASCPLLSVLFAGRDEAEGLPSALEAMLGLDYPNYEIVAVDDRSQDATPSILAAAARRDRRVKPIRVEVLPAGWLGKPHALQQAYENASGHWLVFTDADVHFSPDVLRRAITLVSERNWEHMTLLCGPRMFTFGEKLAMTFFGMAFLIGTRPWEAGNIRSRGYSGVGAFQMIRRSAYEKLGAHRRLAMEVVDDMKLGKLAKQAGVRSGVAKGGDYVRVHWHRGLVNTIRGTEKNFFAATGFKLWRAAAQICAVLLLCVFPVVAIPFAHGPARVFAVIATALPIVATLGVAAELKTPFLYALTFPLGALLFSWMLARSTIATLWRRGIIWRGTFYPIEELKRGLV
jgi:glycosyltransferase involved in cell wall biosynthesis